MELGTLWCEGLMLKLKLAYSCLHRSEGFIATQVHAIWWSTRLIQTSMHGSGLKCFPIISQQSSD